jgi:hypothetical protein
MRYERVTVKRDSQTTYNKGVFPWEIPILEFTFEEGNVQRLHEFEVTDMAYPEAREEFFRLEKAYGSDPDSGIPYVASVYGQAQAGVSTLRKLIAEAQAAEEAAKPKRRRRKLEFANDPLMA